MMYVDVKIRRHAHEGEKGRPAGIPIRKEDVQPAFSEMVRKKLMSIARHATNSDQRKNIPAEYNE